MTDFLLHGGSLTLAWFLIVNVAMSAIVALGARSWRDRSPVRSAPFWFAARISSAATACLFVGLVFMPSYWKYEPRESGEGFDITLTLLAVGAIALIAVALARGAIAYRGAMRRTRSWMRTARPLVLDHTDVPAFEIDADAPIMALVGIFRPRLFITRGLIHSLSPEELDASVAHEIGHSSAWDNLQRLVMRASPDLLAWTAGARTIERRWASASEYRADWAAAAGSPFARCALASALVKIARMMPPAGTRRFDDPQPISALVDGGDIASRVERLLADAPPPLRRRGTPAAVAGVVAAVTAMAIYSSLLQQVHAATEILVNSLP